MRSSHGRKHWSYQICSYLLLIFASSALPCSNGEDRLAIGMSIRGKQNLTSDGESFALGFFSPGNSTNQYLGIWYNKIPGQTVVWIANRESPLSRNSSEVFMLNRDGNLVLMDGTRYIWSSNISFANGTVNNSTVVILQNSGNLILRDGMGMVLWQSFDHPTDTLLPGMKIGLNKKTGQNGLLTSWKAEDDPRSGDFAIGVDPQRPIQLVIWNKSLLHWRSNVWDGNLFQTTIEGSLNNYLSYIAYTKNNDGFYLMFGVSDNSIVSRWVLNTTGVVELLSWQENSKKWAVLWGFPRDDCDIYGRCGPFGSCDTNNKPGVCNCLTGFKPTIQKDSENRNWSGGCVRQTELKCDKGDKFIRLAGMKLPDHFIAAGNLTADQCEMQCQKNCSCMSYAYVNTSTVGVKWRCIHWGENLTDLRRIYVGGHSLYVRFDGSEVGASGKGQGGKNKKMIVIPVAITVGILLIGTLCCLFYRRKFKKPKRGRRDMRIKLKASTSLGIKNGLEVNSFSLSCILAATDSFSAANKLGEGGFGPVFQGSLVDGREIAVKRLSKKSGQGLEEFMNEVTVIAKLQHKNLVRLLGCCIQKEEKMLIYEYMPNKSLDKYLFDPSKQVNLDWNLRFRIIEGIAQGILYLHKYSRLRIIHRDLKASNILLDDSMNPKISDFGMARIFGGNQTEANTGRVVGTLGYMSPEYALNGLFSEKSDVFSFGVLLIEIISSKRNTGLYPTDHIPTLLGYAWELWREDRALELIDQSIRDSCAPREVLKCVQIGLLCVQEDAATRPTMSSIVSMLSNENSTLPSPEQPGFFMKRSSAVVDSGNSSNISQSYSINEVTITSTFPR